MCTHSRTHDDCGFRNRILLPQTHQKRRRERPAQMADDGVTNSGEHDGGAKGHQSVAATPTFPDLRHVNDLSGHSQSVAENARHSCCRSRRAIDDDCGVLGGALLFWTIGTRWSSVRDNHIPFLLWPHCTQYKGVYIYVCVCVHTNYIKRPIANYNAAWRRRAAWRAICLVKCSRVCAPRVRVQSPIACWAKLWTSASYTHVRQLCANVFV